MSFVKSVPDMGVGAKAKAKAKAAWKRPLAKGKTMKKAPLAKGKLKAGSSSDKAMKKVKKAVLKKSSLAKLGKMTLAQKVAKAAENTEDPAEAAQELKGMLSKQEHTRVWSKYNCHLRGQGAQEKEDFKNANKAGKGFLAALHMVKSSVPKFFHLQESLSNAILLDKREEWKMKSKW